MWRMISANMEMCAAHGCAAAYQKAVREQRLAAEISAAKRERDFYLSRVDRAKAVAAQAERKRKVCCQADAWLSLHVPAPVKGL